MNHICVSTWTGPRRNWRIHPTRHCHNLLISQRGFRLLDLLAQSQNGVSYSHRDSNSQYRLDSLQGWKISLLPGAELLRSESLASIQRDTGMALVSHYDANRDRYFTIGAAARDLGGDCRRHQRSATAASELYGLRKCWC
jgi:hypothetical protein